LRTIDIPTEWVAGAAPTAGYSRYRDPKGISLSPIMLSSIMAGAPN